MDRSGQKVFVIFNPKAGNAADADLVRDALAKHFPQPQWAAEIYETTGKEDEDIPAICRTACKKGAAMVISAGGDGTLVGVANGLVNGPTPLGILPLGTGNDLARILGIPLKLEDALAALAGDNTAIEVDALKVGDQYYLSNVSVGISPIVMKETKSEQKKRFGMLAYLWTVIKHASIFQLHRYYLTVDGQRQSIHAAEVMVSNTTLLEALPHVFGPPENLNDGQLEVYLVTAHTFQDYLQLVWDLLRRPGQSAKKLFHLGVKQSIVIETRGSSQLVQADGEVIGRTPVKVELIPKAIRVIMPKPQSDQPANEMETVNVPEHVG
ncbi:MAG: diacylglycerol kinase family protein [Chloroflexota bacterium]